MTTVAGTIVFSKVVARFDNAKAVVRYEDCSRAGDVSPRVVAEQEIRGISIDAADPQPIPFSLDVPESEASEGCSLSVHVDVSGTGDITIGDYITTKTFPVSASKTLRVTVDPVE